MDIVFDNVFRWHCLLMHCLLRGPAPRSMGENSATYDRYVHNTHSIAIYTYIDNVTQTYLSTLLLLFPCIFPQVNSPSALVTQWCLFTQPNSIQRLYETLEWEHVTWPQALPSSLFPTYRYWWVLLQTSNLILINFNQSHIVSCVVQCVVPASTNQQNSCSSGTHIWNSKEYKRKKHKSNKM